MAATMISGVSFLSDSNDMAEDGMLMHVKGWYGVGGLQR